MKINFKKALWIPLMLIAFPILKELIEIAYFTAELSKQYNIFIGALFILGLIFIAVYDIKIVTKIYDFFTSEPRK